jgi:hypothetical protein
MEYQEKVIIFKSRCEGVLGAIVNSSGVARLVELQ